MILSRCLLLNDKLYLCFTKLFSFPWDYYLNLLDLNLFTWFGWPDCKVNLSVILRVHILCEGGVVDQFLFCISMCVIFCYVDIFQYTERQFNFSNFIDGCFLFKSLKNWSSAFFVRVQIKNISLCTWCQWFSFC